VDGRRVHTDMEMWTEIRRKVLVEGVSKRSIRRDFRIGSETLEKILANAEPPGYRQGTSRPKPQLGQFLGIIDEILLADNDAPVKQRHTAKRIFERLRDEHPTEAANNLIKRVKRAAFGFTSFRNYRIRALLYAGKPNWDLLATVKPH